MASSSLEDAVKKKKLLKELEEVEDKIFANGEECDLHYQQGRIFSNLCTETKDSDVKFAYMLACAECFWQRGTRVSPHCGHALYVLAQMIDSVLYFKKVVKKGEYIISLTSRHQYDSDVQMIFDLLKKNLEVARSRIKDLRIKDLASETSSVKDAGSNTAASKTSSVEIAEPQIAASETSSVENAESNIAASSMERGEPKDSETKKSPDPVPDEKERLKSYWRGLNVNIKREFMKVNIAELRSFAKRKGLNEDFLFLGKKGLFAFDQVLSSASKDKSWKFWMCRTLCSEKFSSAEECKKHLEQQHAADFKLYRETVRVQRIAKDWENRINAGEWEPVNTEEAVEMIKNRPAEVKAFAPKSKSKKGWTGWSKIWPVAAGDTERSELLQGIKSHLVSFCKLQILPCSIRDWLMHFPVKHLRELEVSEQSIIDLHIKDTPQSICFLPCPKLIQIRDFLKLVECERKDGTDLVCRAVDSHLGSMKVTDKIELDGELSYLFLDRGLLKGKIDTLEDAEGTIGSLENPTQYYARVNPKGDDFISWLTDSSAVDQMFSGTIREHNFVIWVAVMRAFQFTCRSLKSKYDKKVSLKGDKVMLMDSKILLVDNSRIKLLEELTNLSVFDNRLCMLRLLKPFLLYKIESMVSEATAAQLVNKVEKENKEKEAAAAELRNKEDNKKSQALKKINKTKKKSSTRMSSPLDKTVESEPSANPDTLASEIDHLKISPNTDNPEDATIVDPDMQNTPGEDSQLEHLESALGGAVDMTLKALLNNKAVQVDIELMEEPSNNNAEKQVTCALQKVCTAFKSEVLEEVYSVLLSELVASLKGVISMSWNAAEVLMTILQFWPPEKDGDIQSVVGLFLVTEDINRRCKKCKWDPNYSEQWYYSLAIDADSIRDLKIAFGNIKFEYILKLIRKADKMLCDIKIGGCGETNFERHLITAVPVIFTVVLEWEKNENGGEISETMKALELEIDISRIYEVSPPDINNINYRLVSMVCCGEKNEHIYLAYKDNGWWVSLIHGSLEKQDVGDWESVVTFCEKSKFRPEILFYQAIWGAWADFGLF